jgi:nicotinate phosphoribosyltransferase
MQREGERRRILASDLSMLTDLYQLTMVYAAWRSGTLGKEAVFDLYFRQNPFDGGFAIACGLQAARELIESFEVTSEQAEYLGSLRDARGESLFQKDFLQFLTGLELSVDIDAVPEGRVVFAGEPLLRIQGPLYQCQLLETALLNLINFETLIATKAARVKMAAGEDQVLEFGLRRAQGTDGGVSASRAAYVGGADATSNVLAGQLFGVPVRGTHAHSWVMSFEDEQTAFDTFADAMPGNTVLLVDTYDTLTGVDRAIATGLRMKAHGHTLAGIRLDSGDLAYLSVEARRRLDLAGLANTKIVASNDLDEKIIASLKAQGAKIDIWGVGTKLVTAYDQPALGGVYKLTALRELGRRDWSYRVKLSEQTVKVTTPGIHQVRRFQKDGLFDGDMIFDIHSATTSGVIVDPLDPTRRKRFGSGGPAEDLLLPLVRQGRGVASRPTLTEARERRASDLRRLHPGVTRFLNPHQYPVGLELGLHNIKTEMILKLRGFSEESEQTA